MEIFGVLGLIPLNDLRGEIIHVRNHAIKPSLMAWFNSMAFTLLLMHLIPIQITIYEGYSYKGSVIRVL